MGLILKRIKPGSEVLNLVLKGRRRTSDSRAQREVDEGVVGRWMDDVDG